MTGLRKYVLYYRYVAHRCQKPDFLGVFLKIDDFYTESGLLFQVVFEKSGFSENSITRLLQNSPPVLESRVIYKHFFHQLVDY